MITGTGDGHQVQGGGEAGDGTSDKHQSQQREQEDLGPGHDGMCQLRFKHLV